MKHDNRTRRPTRRHGIRALAIAAAAALALAGCSVQVRSQPDPNIGPGTMLINADHGNPLFIRNFNPYASNVQRTAARWIYEPLLLLNPLNGDLTPWLASAYQQPDPRTIDMTVRQGVTWSDGTAFTAKDIAFTFQLLKKNPALDIYGAWTHIRSIDTSDGHVVFHLKSDDVPAVTVIGRTYIVAQHTWSKVSGDPNRFADPHPVGTGPFVLGNYSDQQYSMDKNPKYWQAKKIDIDHILLSASNTQLDTLTRGYDWGYAFLSDVKGTWGAASPDNTWWFPAGGVIALLPNLTKAPFNNVDVRRGMSLALDRDRIADSATEGNLKAATQTGLLLPNQEDVLNPDIPDNGVVAQDRDGAIASFQKAGYTLQGDKMVDSSGKQLTFTIKTANGFADWLRAVQEVRRDLGAIGIEVKIQAPQPAGFFAAVANGDFDVAMGTMGGGVLFDTYNNLLASSFYQPIGKQASFNFERYRSAEADKLLTEYKSTTDEAKQKQLLQQLQSIVYDELPAIGMYYGGLWGLFNDAKFTGWPSAKDPYMAPQDYDSPALGIFVKVRRVEK